MLGIFLIHGRRPKTHFLIQIFSFLFFYFFKFFPFFIQFSLFLCIIHSLTFETFLYYIAYSTKNTPNTPKFLHFHSLFILIYTKIHLIYSFIRTFLHYLLPFTIYSHLIHSLHRLFQFNLI